MEGDGLWKDADMVGEEVVSFRRLLQGELHEGVARGPAQSSRQTLGSHAKYFSLFAAEVGADEERLGSPCEPRQLPVRQAKEEEFLLQFLWYVSKYPRAAAKKKSGKVNSV